MVKVPFQPTGPTHQLPQLLLAEPRRAQAAPEASGRLGPCSFLFLLKMRREPLGTTHHANYNY